MKGKLTISDIASMAGVSKTTVSFVLNNREGVSEETRQKVLSVIQQTNYTPTLNSRRLYYQKNFTIAVVFDKKAQGLDNLFSFSIMNALMKRCTHYDYALIYSEYSVEGDHCKLPQIILNKDVDGLIFLRDIPLPLISKLHALGIPFVVADDHSEHTALHTVKVDYAQAARAAVGYLVQQGHRKIGFMGNANLPSFYTQIISGFQEALKTANLPLELDWFFDKVQSKETMQEAIAQLSAGENRPTAIFCMEDILAVDLMRCLQSAGIRVPEDISVISIDDIVISGLTFPALTTVGLDKAKLGTYAVDLLIRLINGENPESITISSNDLVIRESVAKRG